MLSFKSACSKGARQAIILYTCEKQLVLSSVVLIMAECILLPECRDCVSDASQHDLEFLTGRGVYYIWKTIPTQHAQDQRGNITSSGS